MNAHDVAEIAKNLAMAPHPQALAVVFLSALTRFASLRAACVYVRDAAGDQLLPLASVPRK